MATIRLTQRQLAHARNALRREEMEDAVADGRLERDQSDARWTAATKARDTRGKRRDYC
jgi:hypothetical protein